MPGKKEKIETTVIIEFTADSSMEFPSFMYFSHKRITLLKNLFLTKLTVLIFKHLVILLLRTVAQKQNAQYAREITNLKTANKHKKQYANC